MSVPKRLIQVWIGPKPSPETWMRTWADQNPDFGYKVYREADIDAFGLVNRNLYDRLYRIKRFDGCSDLVRAEVLLREGGVYVDADSRALRPLVGASFLEAPFFVVEEKTHARDYLLNGAFMGAVPDHPILQEYVEALGGVTKLVPTWITTGPVLLTDVVQRVGGAEVLPPHTFFTRMLSGEPVIGGEPYGEHYFASTVGRELRLTGKQYPTHGSAEGLSILVAFRDDPPGRRTELWNLIRARFEREFPEAEIVVGSDDGVPFNKPAALNRAAAQASGTVFLIADADTWIDPALIHEARELVEAHPRRWVKPWNQKQKLDEATTRAVLAQGASWDGFTPSGAGFENVNSYQHAPPVVLPRSMWEAVGGMDERMPGWGSEDAALSFCLQALFGNKQTLAGKAVHLYHPRIGESGRDTWPGQESPDTNQELYVAYRRASRSAEAMRGILAERDRTLAPLA